MCKNKASTAQRQASLLNNGNCERVDPRTKVHIDLNDQNYFFTKAYYSQGGSWTIGQNSMEACELLVNHWISLSKKKSGIVKIEIWRKTKYGRWYYDLTFRSR